MDVYSYGLILWEIWHQSIPFDNDVTLANTYVVQENSRPKIIRSIQDMEDLSDEEDNKDEESKTNNEQQNDEQK